MGICWVFSFQSIMTTYILMVFKNSNTTCLNEEIDIVTSYFLIPVLQ